MPDKIGFNLNQILIFITVVELGSFSDAASALNLSQPRVSQALSELEILYGVNLITRKSRPIEVTEKGRKVYQLSKRIYNQSLQLNNLLQDYSIYRQQNLHIGIIDSLMSVFAKPLISSLSNSTNSIQLRSGFIPNLTKELELEMLDLIITSSDINDDYDVVTYDIFKDSFVIILPINYKDFTINELLNKPFIGFNKHSKIYTKIQNIQKEMNWLIEPNIEVDTTDILFNLVEQQIGWGITTTLSLSKANPTLVSAKSISSNSFTRAIKLISKSELPIDTTLLVQETLLNYINSDLLPVLDKNFPNLALGSINNVDTN